MFFSGLVLLLLIFPRSLPALKPDEVQHFGPLAPQELGYSPAGVGQEGLRQEARLALAAGQVVHVPQTQRSLSHHVLPQLPPQHVLLAVLPPLEYDQGAVAAHSHFMLTADAAVHVRADAPLSRDPQHHRTPH